MQCLNNFINEKHLIWKNSILIRESNKLNDSEHIHEIFLE